MINNKATCLIVDDERVSREVLKKYIREVPSLQLVGECRDAFEATGVLSSRSVDILFLDINMPRLSGISLARSLTRSPLLIFTTAYPEFAVEGYDLDAVDYLVKPFSLERFIKAVNKALDKLPGRLNENQDEPSLLIRSGKKIFTVKPSGITVVEACGDYIKVRLEDQTCLLVHDTMKAFLSTLPGNLFMRIHKSFAINLSHVRFIEGNRVSVSDLMLPVSPDFRRELMDRLK